jgi:hypothetical protein
LQQNDSLIWLCIPLVELTGVVTTEWILQLELGLMGFIRVSNFILGTELDLLWLSSLSLKFGSLYFLSLSPLDLFFLLSESLSSSSCSSSSIRSQLEYPLVKLGVLELKSELSTGWFPKLVLLESSNPELRLQVL